MATLAWGEEDEWELINDDGFVYKRKKRSHISSAAAPPPPDPAADENRRRLRKRRALLKLKETYNKEIRQWELLSNTFNALHLQTLNLRQQQQQLPDQFGVTRKIESPSPDSDARKLLDDLLAQVEAQEAMIINVSKLCDAAEALCNVQEERSKQAFIDLPIWDSSPHELINSLCE